MRELLHPIQRASDIEVFDDSEEEDRIASRRARGLGVVSSQTQCLTFTFYCGVLFVISLLWFFFKGIANGRQRLGE